MKIAADKLRNDMSELWKEIFHDSDSYISLVFDTYFQPENVAYRYDGDRLIAMMLGVEYHFHSCERVYSGIYLCGLATRPEYRNKGIMGELMKEIEDRARHRLFDFLFLIPADDHLRRYYSRFGYENMSQKYTEKYRFCADVSAYGKLKLLSDGSAINDSGEEVDILPILSRWDSATGYMENTIYMDHSSRDSNAVFKEWILSGGGILGRMDVSRKKFDGFAMVDSEGVVRMKLPMDAKDWKRTESEEMYGMMKPLRSDIPAAENFSIGFLLD